MVSEDQSSVGIWKAIGFAYECGLQGDYLKRHEIQYLGRTPTFLNHAFFLWIYKKKWHTDWA
jgi:hypothetical protein